MAASSKEPAGGPCEGTIDGVIVERFHWWGLLGRGLVGGSKKDRKK